MAACRGRSIGTLDASIRHGAALQYIENSALALRAAHYALIRRPEDHRFLLFPMIHIGTSEYYSQVRLRLEDCDVILFEGVRSWRGWLLTLSYSIVARRKRLGLITQRDASLLKGLRARLVHTDLGPGEFHERWSAIPWFYRIMVLVGAPLYGIYLFLTATRESIGRRLSTDDVSSAAREYEDAESAPGLNEAIVTSRDRRLTERIESLVSPSSKAGVVGIIYGAGHMRSVTDTLMGRHRFRVSRSEWITVFDYADVQN
jgi:hypothetical protein